MMIDFHTHQLHNNDLMVFNLVLKPGENPKVPKQRYTVGVHPWWCYASESDFDPPLIELLQMPKCLGLGEIGLDRAKGSPWNLQMECYKRQLQLAVKLNLPMVVLHCVRAYQELWQEIERVNYQGTLVFHDYNGEPAFTKQMIKRERVYFCYGEALFRRTCKGLESLPLIPKNLLLLETDDTGKPIEEIYRRAGEVLNLAPTDLERQILSNFNQILPR